MAKIKLIDVAQRAGVSKSTVSQYLNGRFDYMSKETKERVKLAIDDLNYVPNPIARSLKTDKTKTIGVIVRDITGYDTSQTIRAIDDFCKNKDYNVIIYNTDFNAEIEKKSLHALQQLRVDGIIIASSGSNTKIINEFILLEMPVVQFQIEYDGNERNMIVSDYRQAAFEATDYLINLGHKKICFLTQDFKNVKSRNERYLGYLAALEKHGIPLDDQLIHYWHRETGFTQLPNTLLNADIPPTAFFSQHLAITTELLKNLNQANISIPDDVSLLGFDDLPMAEFFKVPITVIKQEPHRIGLEAAKVLLDNIENKENLSHRVMVPCTLAKRASCKQL
jgi:DNA-binding LacI/PurR family transcriptional regulator